MGFGVLEWESVVSPAAGDAICGEHGTDLISGIDAAGLISAMLAKGLLTQVAIFVGSEGVRGVKKMGIKRPSAATFSAFTDIITGEAYWGQKADVFSAYGAAKYVGALWMSSLVRRYPRLRLVTISPGGTKGTNAAKSMPAPMRFFATYIFAPLLATPLGLMHSLEAGAKRNR